MCIHLHVLACVFGSDKSHFSATSAMPPTSASTHGESSSEASVASSIARTSTLKLAISRKLPYKVSKEIIRTIMRMDANCILNLPSGWPEKYMYQSMINANFATVNCPLHNVIQARKDIRFCLHSVTLSRKSK